MSEPIKKLTVAALSEKLGKFMSNLQIAQQKTDSTLSIMMNEIQEIRKSQEYSSSKYEEIKMNWKLCKISIKIWNIKMQFWNKLLLHCKNKAQKLKLKWII